MLETKVSTTFEHLTNEARVEVAKCPVDPRGSHMAILRDTIAGAPSPKVLPISHFPPFCLSSPADEGAPVR